MPAMVDPGGPGAALHVTPPAPTAAEVAVAVRVLRYFAAEGLLGEDLEAAAQCIGALRHALRARGRLLLGDADAAAGPADGGAAADAAPERAERWWRLRWFPSRAELLRRFEAQNTLGVEASCISGATWEVSHPPLDPDVAYAEGGAPPFLVEPDALIAIPRVAAGSTTWSTADATQISLQRYTDAAGDDRRIKVRIWRTARQWGLRAVDDARDDLRPIDQRELVEEKVLRTASGDGVDARAVVFRCRLPGGATHYFRIRLSGSGDEFELREVRPVRRAAVGAGPGSAPG